MNKHYKEALIEAAADMLKEQEGIENVDKERLGNLMELPVWEETDEDASFKGDVEMLVDMYLEGSQKSIEESIEEVCSKLHVGFNFVEGIGVGYCKDEEDLEAMRNFVRGGMVVQEGLKRQIFG